MHEFMDEIGTNDETVSEEQYAAGVQQNIGTCDQKQRRSIAEQRIGERREIPSGAFRIAEREILMHRAPTWKSKVGPLFA